jgi:hypothetical protein
MRTPQFSLASTLAIVGLLITLCCIVHKANLVMSAQRTQLAAKDREIAVLKDKVVYERKEAARWGRNFMETVNALADSRDECRKLQLHQQADAAWWKRYGVRVVMEEQ